MRSQWLLFILVLCLALPSCATREPISPVISKPEIIPEALLFNEQVAALPEGATQYFPETPFGPATIDAGPYYTSGLGHECRTVRVTTGTTTQSFAFCQEENGTWHFVPSIFESISK